MSRLAFGALGALFASVLFSSCSADQRAPARLAEGCLINSDCTSPLVCAFQRCHNECTDSRDCSSGQRCVASDRPFKVCELAIEKDCSTNVDCPPGMVCGVDGQCRDQCSSSNDCISGQLCTSGTCADEKELVDGGLPVVEREGGADSTPCVYSSDCPEPLVCKSGMCLVECRSDRDCDYLAACVDNRCRLSTLPGAGAGGTSGGGPDGSAGETSSGGASNSGGATSSGGASNSGGATSSGGAGGTPNTPPGGALTCKTRGTTGATLADADITTDQTWSGTIHVTRDVSLYGGAILTIKPGTNIVVDGGHSIDFGWNAGTATVMAEGTATQPITFCGATATPGAWYGLIVEKNVAATSVFANVLVSDSGGTDAGLKLLTNVTVNNVQVHGSGSDGVWATDFHTGSTALSVDGSVGAAVVLNAPGAVARFPLGGALANNGSNVAKLNFDYVDDDTEFHELGVPYLQAVDVDVEGSATVTFDAGIEYRVAATHQLRVGYNNGGSTIAVDGTAAAPVTFRGETAVSGNWNGIIIDASVTSNSHIRHASILHAGHASPALTVSAPITLDNVSLDKNKSGVQIAAGGLNADSTMLSITGTADVPLTIAPNSIPTLPTGGTFTGNATDQIVVQGTSYTEKGTAPNLGLPYFFAGDLDVTQGSSLTVAPGVTFIMSAGARLDVGYASTAGTLIAKGTAAAPISFVGLDTSSGYWDGIYFEATALSTSVLDRVIIKNAGVAMDGGIRLYKEIAVTNTTVSGSAGYGIAYSKAFTTNYATTNTLTGNAQGPTVTF